ncbi:hypothetical protein L9G15_25825, partial [Shewanella sp. A3A]|nr:hypothetical protein [Shewanella ferrihydritica]
MTDQTSAELDISLKSHALAQSTSVSNVACSTVDSFDHCCCCLLMLEEKGGADLRGEDMGRGEPH